MYMSTQTLLYGVSSISGPQESGVIRGKCQFHGSGGIYDAALSNVACPYLSVPEKSWQM